MYMDVKTHGQRALKRMPSRACTMASSRVMARTAPLDAVSDRQLYTFHLPSAICAGPSNGEVSVSLHAICGVAAPILATNDATLMIDPPIERPFSASDLF